MKKAILLIVAVLLHSFSYGQNESELRNELLILKPLLGKTWVCESMHPSGQMKLNMVRTFESINGGKLVKQLTECQELNYQDDQYYYFDSEKNEIAIFLLASNGNISVGNLKEEEGKLLFYGDAIFPNRKTKYKMYWEMNPEGKIVDKYYQYREGEWQAGHSRVWSIK